jgi:uncharacterized protein
MGTLFRIILILIVVGLVLMYLKRTFKNRSQPPAAQSQSDMLRCDYCGVFVPRGEAVSARGRHYCSSAHLDADRPK